MRFLVCQKQHGQGCDYTIGCGMRFDYVDAESVEAAIEKVVWPDGRGEEDEDEDDMDCALIGDSALSDILVIPAEHVVTVNVEKMTAEVEAAKIERRAKERKRKELAELKRLQAKYSKRKEKQ